MPLFENNQPTVVERGDDLCVDTYNEVIRIRRNGRFLLREDGSDIYCVLPQDGEGIEVLAELVADAVGLRFEEIEEDNSDIVVYRFS